MAFTVPRGSLSSLRLPFAIAQHLHPRESKRWLLPPLPLPAGRAGWGIRCDRPMKPTFLRPGSGQSQGGRSRTLRHTRSEAHTHTLTEARAHSHSHLHTHTQHNTGRGRRGGDRPFSRSIGLDAHRTKGGKESGLTLPSLGDHVSFKFSSTPNPHNSRAGDILTGRREG